MRLGGKGGGLPPSQESAPESSGIPHSLTENFRKNWFGSGGLEAEVNRRSKLGGRRKGGKSERICFKPVLC